MRNKKKMSKKKFKQLAKRLESEMRNKRKRKTMTRAKKRDVLEKLKIDILTKQMKFYKDTNICQDVDRDCNEFVDQALDALEDRESKEVSELKKELEEAHRCYDKLAEDFASEREGEGMKYDQEKPDWCNHIHWWGDGYYFVGSYSPFRVDDDHMQQHVEKQGRNWDRSWVICPVCKTERPKGHVNLRLCAEG